MTREALVEFLSLYIITRVAPHCILSFYIITRVAPHSLFILLLGAPHCVNTLRILHAAYDATNTHTLSLSLSEKMARLLSMVSVPPWLPV